MDKIFLINAVISFSFSILMFFIIVLIQQIPLPINIIVNGEESNKLVLNGLTYIFPLISLLSSFLFLFLSKKSTGFKK